MTNLIAIAPKEGKISSYLTNGKEYPIIEWHKWKYQGQDWFYITDDNGDERFCVPEYDFHLNGLNWTIRGRTIFKRPQLDNQANELNTYLYDLHRLPIRLLPSNI